MKRILFVLLSLLMASGVFAQSDKEKVGPSYNIEMTKKMEGIILNEEKYYDVTISIKSSNSIDETVKVTVKDSNGKTLFKKKLNAYLYLFSDGVIQIGKPRFIQIMVFKSSESGNYIGKIDLNGLN